MYVCLCKGITDSDIKDCVEQGHTSFRQTRKQLELASECGQCSHLAKSIFNDALADQRAMSDLFYAAS